MTKYLITSALPYANGPLHFGHLAGAYLPADVYARHRKRQGGEVLFISGSDEHGVAIMLNSKKEGKGYKEYVDGWHAEHANIFKKYKVDFDFFGQTSASYHEEEVLEVFNILYKKGLIGTKDCEQLFCKDCKNHLPDRFVEGTCYSCDFEKARGDECPKCGIWIEPTKLINPVCKICESHNIETVTVTQYYLLLSKYHKEFMEWLGPQESGWRKTVFNYVKSLVKEGLVDRAITRDLDWGIDVPLAEAKGKKLYVWFDAPIGYVSNTKEFLKQSGRSDHYLNDWWKNKDTEITNFVGKDNIIFHCIIFPMMSMASERYNACSDVPANQYLNLEGKQFSKSTGHYVDTEEALDQFGSDALRYYLIAIAPESSDSSFTWEGLQTRVNNELANNIGNLVNRCLKFWAKNWPDGIDANYFISFINSEEGQKISKAMKEHSELLDNKEIKKGLEYVMSVGHIANNYFSDKAPWAQFKEDEQEAAKTIAETGVYILCLANLLAPYLPELSSNIISYYDLELKDDCMSDLYKGDFSSLLKLLNGNIKLSGKPKALVPKVEDDVILKLNESLQGK
jgi:methionyl-tRNA synthetase